MRDVCDVMTLARVHGTQFNANVTGRASHHTDVLVRDAVVGTDWLVEGRTRRRTDADTSVTHSAVSTHDTVTHFCQHSQHFQDKFCDFSLNRSRRFLQRVGIACYADRCICYGRIRPAVCSSVLPSHSGVLSRRMKLRSCGFHHQVGQSS